MSNELTGTATAIIAACNFLGRLALFGGDCFNLALTRKSRRFFWASVCKKWGIFECFLKVFCSLWWRYIDDIFFCTHGEDKLEDFINHINSLYSTIKFTHEVSKSHISVLDVMVLLDNNNKISTDLFVKSTDTHQYLLHTSCHPSHIKNLYLSASLCVFIVSASPLRNFNKEPMNCLNSYANVDTDDSTCNHK